MEELGCALVNFSAFGDIIDDVLIEDIHAAHLLVDQRQVLNILGSVLDHGLSQGSLLPELDVVLHLTIDFIFFCVYFADVFF